MSEPILRVDNLCKNFGGVVVLDGVSLAVDPGKIHGVIGPNGAGKTTLFDLLSGSLPAAGGRVLLAGDDISGLRAPQRSRRGLGRSFQDARLFPSLTVDETIAVALERWVQVGDPLSAAFHLPNAIDSGRSTAAESAVTSSMSLLMRPNPIAGRTPRTNMAGEPSIPTGRVTSVPS